MELASFNFAGQNTGLLTFFGWLVGAYLYAGLGITLGYHRLLTHRALKVPKWFMYFITFGGYFALMGAPLSWVATHRLHHQKSDQPGDPHSPRDGFFHAFMGWWLTGEMAQKQPAADVRRQVQDLINDPFLAFFGTEHGAGQAQMCLWTNIAIRVAIFYFFGWQACLGAVLGSGFVFFGPQLVNTICHLKNRGYRNFEISDDSRNVFWVAMWALGEGWHNNHHAIPRSARHGMMWYEFDLTWCAISLLEMLGIAKDVVRPNLEPALARSRALAERALKVTEDREAALREAEEAIGEAVTVGSGKR